MAAIKPLVFTRDANNYADRVFPLSCHSNVVVLAAATNETLAVPAGAKVALISSSAEAWVKVDGTFSAVPATDISSGAAGVCLRAGVVYEFGVEDLGGTNLNFIATATPTISVAFA